MGFVKNQETEKKYYEDKYNIDNPVDRITIQQFINTYGKKNLQEVLIQEGCFRYSEKYPNGAVDQNKIMMVNDLTDKYKAAGKLMDRREYAQNIQRESIQSLL